MGKMCECSEKERNKCERVVVLRRERVGFFAFEGDRRTPKMEDS